VGLPEAAENSPSPVATASAALKRIQVLSSATKAASAICALLPRVTYSRICSNRSLAVNNRT
jgi:hypothetical protein